VNFQAALSKFAEVEAAIGAGDLQLAGNVLEALKPMLVSDQVNELVTLKAKLANMQAGVLEVKSKQAMALRELNNKKQAASTYRDNLSSFID